MTIPQTLNRGTSEVSHVRARPGIMETRLRAATALALSLLLSAGWNPVRAQAGPFLLGRVLADSSESAIPGALVALPGLGLSVRADSLGRFSFPARLSTRLVIVRVLAIGYTPIDEALELPEGDTASVEFVMSRTAQLVSTVRVIATTVDRRLREFERRRSEGFGTFFDDSIIRRQARSGRIGHLIRTAPGLTLVTPGRGTVGTEQYVVGGRGSELTLSGARPCYSGVVLDGVWVYSGQRAEPLFNINSVAAETVRAIEVYRSTAQIPVEFNRLGNFCGLVVIWLK